MAQPELSALQPIKQENWIADATRIRAIADDGRFQFPAESRARFVQTDRDATVLGPQRVRLDAGLRV